MVDYEFLEAFSESVLGMSSSIRWVGIASSNAVILSTKQRAGLEPLLTQEENEEYIVSAISRRKTRSKFESEIGRLRYAFGKYEKLNRVTVPINEYYYLLITLDSEEKDFDRIITDRILPAVDSNAGKFASPAGENLQSEYESGTFRCSICAKESLTKHDADEHYKIQHKGESVRPGW
jgi:hypothetical protein